MKGMHRGSRDEMLWTVQTVVYLAVNCNISPSQCVLLLLFVRIALIRFFPSVAFIKKRTDLLGRLSLVPYMLPCYLLTAGVDLCIQESVLIPYENTGYVLSLFYMSM